MKNKDITDRYVSEYENYNSKIDKGEIVNNKDHWQSPETLKKVSDKKRE